MMPQHNPITSSESEDVTPIARQVFLDTLLEREELGIETYGVSLQTHNGRSAIQDAIEEAVDLWQYLIQIQMERADLERQLEEAIESYTAQAYETHKARRWATAWKQAAKEQWGNITVMLARIAELGLATELEVKELHFRAGKLDAVFRHPLFLYLAKSAIDLFFEDGAENYLSFRLGPDERGMFSLTIQREGGISPAEKVGQLETELATARERIAELEGNLAIIYHTHPQLQMRDRAAEEE